MNITKFSEGVKRWRSCCEELRAWAQTDYGLYGTITPRQVLQCGLDMIECELENPADLEGQPYPYWMTKVLRNMIAAAYDLGDHHGLTVYEQVSYIRRHLTQRRVAT